MFTILVETTDIWTRCFDCGAEKCSSHQTSSNIVIMCLWESNFSHTSGHRGDKLMNTTNWNLVILYCISSTFTQHTKHLKTQQSVMKWEKNNAFIFSYSSLCTLTLYICVKFRNIHICQMCIYVRRQSITVFNMTVYCVLCDTNTQKCLASIYSHCSLLLLLWNTLSVLRSTFFSRSLCCWQILLHNDCACIKWRAQTGLDTKNCTQIQRNTSFFAGHWNKR